jgi:hypothetical protein
MKGNQVARKVEKLMVGRSTAAAMFDVSAQHLANLLCRGEGPRAYRMGGKKKVLYDVQDLQAYFHASPIQTIDSIDSVNGRG